MDSVGCYFIDQLQLSLWVRTKDGCRFLLKDRERDTFIKLYALWDDEREWQHQEVADTLHLTRERIRQMEMKAFKKLAYRKKQILHRAGYTPCSQATTHRQRQTKHRWPATCTTSTKPTCPNGARHASSALQSISSEWIS